MKRQTSRRGAALIAVLVAIAALTIILTVVTSQVFAQRKMVQARQHQLQADWLARAGVEWAADRLLQNPNAFTEEKTDLAPRGTVQIVVEKGAANHFTITADASVGEKAGPAVARSHSVRFQRTDKGGEVLLVAVAAEDKKKD